MLKSCPNYVLFVWKEAVIWSLRLQPDLLSLVQKSYNWNGFSEMTVDAMNRIRRFVMVMEVFLNDVIRYLRIEGPVDPKKIEAMAVCFHEGMKEPTSKRVLRLQFKQLVCKHLDGVLRNKLRSGGIAGTGVPGLRCGSDVTCADAKYAQALNLRYVFLKKNVVMT